MCECIQQDAEISKPTWKIRIIGYLVLKF